MTEIEIRRQFAELTLNRELRGFWHTKSGRELRLKLTTCEFKDFHSVQEKVWSLVNDSIFAPKCKICGNRASFFQYSFLDTCGLSCGSKLNNIKRKEAGTFDVSKMIDAARSQKSREKRSATLKNTFKNNKHEINEQRRATCLEKYGVDHPTKAEEIAKRIKQTTFEKYGTEQVFSSTEIRERIRKTNLEKYNKNVFPQRLAEIALTDIEPLFDEWKGSKYPYTWKHSCGYEFIHYLSDGLNPTCPKCRPKSRPQKKVEDFCTTLGIHFDVNSRKAISPYEIDIYFPSLKLGIEINGVHWHNDNRNGMSLKEKTALANKHGIKLLHFWDFEIDDKFEIVKSYIINALGLSEICQIEKCVVEEISEIQFKNFMLHNSLESFNQADKYLTCSNVAMISFKKLTDGETLIRLVLAKNKSVNTIAPFLNETRLRVECDRRFSDDKLFINAGFKLKETLRPITYKFKNKKELIVDGDDFTYEISDCGIDVFVLK